MDAVRHETTTDNGTATHALRPLPCQSAADIDVELAEGQLHIDWGQGSTCLSVPDVSEEEELHCVFDRGTRCFTVSFREVASVNAGPATAGGQGSEERGKQAKSRNRDGHGILTEYSAVSECRVW